MKQKEPPADKGRNLVLIGYRATGKSSVGARLAQILKRPLVDLDRELVAEAGKSVADLVAQGGWEEFRRREKKLVARYRHRRGVVLATGGGVVLDPENVENLRENGIIIWLKAEPATIRERLAAAEAAEPVRPSLTGADPVAEVAAVLASRYPLYEAAAQATVDTTRLSLSQVVDRVLAILHDQEAKPHGG
jgi:shikimate kinase